MFGSVGLLVHLSVYQLVVWSVILVLTEISLQINIILSTSTWQIGAERGVDIHGPQGNIPDDFGDPTVWISMQVCTNIPVSQRINPPDFCYLTSLLIPPE